MKRLFFCAALFLAMSVEVSHAAELDALVGQALEKNPGVQSKKNSYEAAKGKVIDAWLLEDPEFGIDVEGQPSLFNFDRRTDNEYMVLQKIPFPTKLFLRGFGAMKEADIAFQRFKQEEREVVWHMEQPYYELFLARKNIEILEDVKNLTEQLLKSSKARYESGQAPQGDLLKAQIELAKINVEIFNSKQKEHLAQAHFAHILNQPLGTHYDISPKLEREKTDWNLDELEKRAIEKRPELRALFLAADRANIHKTMIQQSWLPDITLRYEGRQLNGDSGIAENDTFIGVTVPVWSILKGLGGDWRAAELDAKAAEAEAVRFKNEVFLKIHEAYSKWKSADNALTAYETMIVPQARQMTEVALASYEAGKSDFLTVIDAERTLKDSQMEYYRSLAESEMGLSDLRLAVGDDLSHK